MIKELKQNKIIKIIFSILFSIMLFLDNKLVYNDNIFSNIKEIYFKKFQLIDILYILIIITIIYIIITLLKMIIDKLEFKIGKQNNKKIFIIIFITLIICWLPYVLSYFPFGIFSDTRQQISQALSGSLDNRHPLLGTLLIKIFIDIGMLFKDLKFGIQLYSIFQLLLMAGVISYFIYWLYKKKVPNIYLILTIIFYGFFKLIPIYVISLWKDTIFSAVLFLYIIDIADISISKFKNLEDKNKIIKHCILIFLVSFLRNNGLYITIITETLLLLIYKKNTIIIFELILFLIIQGPIYNYSKINTPFVENLGIPLQQVAYSVCENKNIDEKDLAFIYNIIPIENLKQSYAPANVDTIKWNEQFNDEYLNKNKIKFFKTWFQILLKNPNSYIKAYLLNTFGYWDINKSSNVGYMSITNWPNVEELIGLTQDDYIKQITGKSIRKYIEPKSFYSSALFTWILLLSLTMSLIKKKNILPLIPLVATILTILVAAPLAFSFRYLYILTFALPFIIIYPLINEN